MFNHVDGSGSYLYLELHSVAKIKISRNVQCGGNSMPGIALRWCKGAGQKAELVANIPDPESGSRSTVGASLPPEKDHPRS